MCQFSPRVDYNGHYNETEKESWKKEIVHQIQSPQFKYGGVIGERW